MKIILSYEISQLVPYINWLYFYHAWGLSGKPEEEKEKMKEEAFAMLQTWEGEFHTHAIFRLLPANADGDDILVYLDDIEPGETDDCHRAKKVVKIPMLRQQCSSATGKPNLCLADFLRPKGKQRDELGMFCTTVDGIITEQYRKDAYKAMLAQTLCDRLAEATAERLHEEVRQKYWGYAPNEQLSMAQICRGEYQGIRPAVGYPSMPDASVNFVLNELLEMQDVNIRITESGMMVPHASVSGLMFSHPQAHYFEVGKVGEDQLRDYARRRGLPIEMARRFLQSSMMKR